MTIDQFLEDLKESKLLFKGRWDTTYDIRFHSYDHTIPRYCPLTFVAVAKYGAQKRLRAWEFAEAAYLIRLSFEDAEKIVQAADSFDFGKFSPQDIANLRAKMLEILSE